MLNLPLLQFTRTCAIQWLLRSKYVVEFAEFGVSTVLKLYLSFTGALTQPMNYAVMRRIIIH